jgi:alpha-L-fucosidase
MDHSFGFNRASTEEHFIGHEELLGTFADIVAKGGNLLLNVGPKGEDASIPDEQAERLAWLGEWTSAGGCSVVGSRPWVTPELSGGGLDWRTWVHDRSVFAALVGGDGADGPLEVRLPGVRATPTTTVRLVRGPGVRTDVEWVDRGGVVGATLPADRGRLPVLELLDVDAAGAGR